MANWLIDNNSRRHGMRDLVLLNFSKKIDNCVCAVYTEWKHMETYSVVQMDKNTLLENLTFDQWKKNVELLTGHHIDWSKIEEGSDDYRINKNKNPL